MDKRAAVVKAALSMVDQEFRPGVQAQCAEFVRYVFDRAGVDVGNSANPIDRLLIPGDPLSPSYANSFAGTDVGALIRNTSSLQPGDIVMWRNTYGNWPMGVITHVGIHTGGGWFVHRPTAARPVEQAHLSGYWLAHFEVACRVFTDVKVTPLPGSDGRGSNDNSKLHRLQLDTHDGKVGLRLDGKKLQVTAMDQDSRVVTSGATSFTMDLLFVQGALERRLKVIHHSDRVSAILDGQDLKLTETELELRVVPGKPAAIRYWLGWEE